MINYKEIWESINNESKDSDAKSQIARRITSARFPVFIATDFKNNIRILYVGLDQDESIDIEAMPRFRGLEITLNVSSIGEFSQKPFIKFAQSIPQSENIFESVISDICDRVVQLKETVSLSSVLKQVLTEWKLFFEKFENKILSIATQKGLFGELTFLKDVLLKKYSCSVAMQFWTGSERTNHDFQIIRNAVEIKTTSSKQHRKFNISSERQLDNTGLDNLYLVLYFLNVHVNMPDRTLPALINEIGTIIQEDPYASFIFEVKLSKYGYSTMHTDKYDVGFSSSGMKTFSVVEGFPRLLQKDVPNGIGDIKYSVVVSACSACEIKNDILQLI